MTQNNFLNFLPTETKHIIVAPLNWGLGHATRSIPIISELIAAGKKVTIASDGEALELLKETFPHLRTIALPPYNVKYTESGLSRIILQNFFNVLSGIILEKRAANKWINALKADAIISDSRFGFRSKSAYSVIVSHQLNLKVWGGPFSSIIHQVNQYLINRFDACWIPDGEHIRLSGDLSINSNIKRKKYIGLLSRLESSDMQLQYDWAILLSGPETARTKLEEELLSVFGHSHQKLVLVRGTNKRPKLHLPDNWTVIERANSEQMNRIIISSKHIISRSGYSSLMDYLKLNKRAFIIPTKGQAEQEYLATYLDGKHGFRVFKKNHILNQE
jgi:hypothetical protein